MKIHLTIFISILLFQKVYSQRIEFSNSIPTQTIRVIPNQFYGGTVSDNVSSIEYFELEGNNDNILGQIISRIFNKNRIILIHNIDGNLFIFNKNGKIIKRISKVEGFKQPKKNLFYRVQIENSNIVAYGPNIRAVYDNDGNLLEKQLNYNFNYENSTMLIGSTFFEYGNPQTYGENYKNNFALKMNDKVLINYNAQDTVHSLFYQNLPIVSNSNNSAYAIYPSTYNIFELNSGGIVKNINFLFPLQNTIDTSEFYIFKNPILLSNYLNKKPEKIYGIGDPIIYKNYLIVKLGSFKIPSWIAINLDNNKVIALNKIMPDKSNDFLPFIDLTDLNTDGDYLYSIIYPNDISKAITYCKEEGHKMRKEYQNLEKSKNPIVVRFKIK